MEAGGKPLPAVLMIQFTGPESISGKLDHPIDLDGPTIPIMTFIRLDNVTIADVDPTWRWLRDRLPGYTLSLPKVENDPVETDKDTMSPALTEKVGAVRNGRNFTVHAISSAKQGGGYASQMVARSKGSLWVGFTMMPRQ
jgi:hypothetical protein